MSILGNPPFYLGAFTFSSGGPTHRAAPPSNMENYGKSLVLIHVVFALVMLHCHCPFLKLIFVIFMLENVRRGLLWYRIVFFCFTAL
ncbi:hypothetical protein GDO78_002717 [Eleutherodactylus coqui]|uniref:Uncharacterized protein n=1 Tax=Eleutherodactylus coqui TaxID=57060 RepID=A0A8J6EY04_ELECQ|nr:hypothetical protein GDO78_002717 [Eleutherodactylus coqui]